MTDDHTQLCAAIDAGKGDLRTKAARESEVLSEIREWGGFSIFWATDSQKRAHAIKRLADRGVIRRIHEANYPWCRYEIVETTT